MNLKSVLNTLNWEVKLTLFFFSIPSYLLLISIIRKGNDFFPFSLKE